jgi:hypothetical protein
MSIIGDHLRDDCMRGGNSQAQIDEAMRLAGLLATRRVRQYAVSVGRGPNETKEGTERSVIRAKAALRSYLENSLFR